MVSATLSGTWMHTEHDDVEDVVGRPGTDVIHSQDIGLGELRLSAEVGVAHGLGVALLVPVRAVDTGIRYLDRATGDEVELAMPDIHHRNERLVRIADPWLLGHLGLGGHPWSLDVRAGVSLPLGHTEDDPFALGDAGQAHQHLQFGTGTFNPIVGVELRRDLGAWSLGGHALTQQAVYENGKGYLAGDKYAAGLAAGTSFGLPAWSFRVGPEVQAETAERWDGVVHTDDGNRGRWDVLAMAGAHRSLGAGFFASATVRARLYTHVVGGQLRYPAVVDLGVGWTLPGR